MRVVISFAVLLALATFVAADPPQEGKPAPDIKLPATQIQKVLPDAKPDTRELSLKDLKGKNVVLFFFPKAMTPGCTIESCGFRDKIEDLAKLDTVVIGISVDTLEDQQKFTDKEKLNFPLFADSTKEITKTYGVLRPDAGVANRVTFIIDKDGVIRKIYTKVTPMDHPAEVVQFIKDLRK